MTDDVLFNEFIVVYLFVSVYLLIHYIVSRDHWKKFCIKKIYSSGIRHFCVRMFIRTTTRRQMTVGTVSILFLQVMHLRDQNLNLNHSRTLFVQKNCWPSLSPWKLRPCAPLILAIYSKNVNLQRTKSQSQLYEAKSILFLRTLWYVQNRKKTDK